MSGNYIIGTDLSTTNTTHELIKAPVANILKVDVWEPKSNYKVPRFHTADRIIGVPLTIRECQACFPDLVSFYHGTLVNINAVEYVNDTTKDFNIRFVNSQFTTALRQDDVALYRKYMYHFQIHPYSTDNEKKSESMLVVDVEARRATFLPVQDIILIDLWYAKKNYQVPRFYTKDKIYTVPLTLEMCHDGLPGFFQANVSNLVNPNEIDHIVQSRKETSIIFKDAQIRASISKFKAKHLSKIFPYIKI